MYAPTTQLEAVNIILATIGEAPIASLTGPLTSDASLALACLNEQTKRVQSDGFPWNTDECITLLPDASGFIWLPLNTANVIINPRRYTDIKPVLRGSSDGTRQQLYDARNQTLLFLKYASGLVADKLITWLDWNVVPEAARRYILIKASRVFADRAVGAETTHQYTEEDERDAKRALDANKVDMAGMNIMTSPDTLQAMNRSGSGIVGII